MSVGEGESGTGVIEGIELSNNVDVDIPVLAMNGEESGPTFLLFSTQHGTEIQGIEVIHRIMRDIVSPEDLRGQLIGVPVGNPLAYMHRLYTSWVDNGDVGDVPADNQNGTATERLANALWEEAWSQADLISNIHCNVRDDSLIYQWINTGNPETAEELERMAESYGVTTIYSDVDESAGETPTLTTLAAREDIPVILEELIDGRWISEPSTTAGVRGHLNIMREFDMIDGDPEPQEDIRLVECEYTGGSGRNRFEEVVRPDAGGLIFPKQTPGDFIEAGEELAEIRDLHGDTVERVEMPMDGYIWAFPCGQSFATSGELQTIESGSKVAYVFSNHTE